MDFNPGELNKRITIVRYEAGTEKDEEGFDVEMTSKPVAVHRCWAKITDESGTKAAGSGTEFSVARRRYFIRYTQKEITTDMFVRYKGQDYAIVRPPNTYGDSGRFIEIWTERREQV